MKSTVIISFMVLLAVNLASTGFANSNQETPFSYEPGKIEPGTMYVYNHFTTTDQIKPQGKKYYYIESLKKGEVKIQMLSIQKGNDLEHTNYTIDLNHMMVQTLEHHALRPKEKLPVDALVSLTLNTDFQDGKVVGEGVHKHKQGIVTESVTYDFKRTPTFFYFFGHMALRIAMRFYPYSRKKVDAWNYTGTNHTGVEIEYLGKETIEVPAGRIRCNKFELSGKGILSWLFGEKGWIWTSAESEKNYVVRYKNNNKTAKWPMKDFQLTKVENITEQAWNRKIDNVDRRE